MSQKLKLNFDVLCDRGNKVASQLGIIFQFSDELRSLYQQFGIDFQHFYGDSSWMLPMPGRFIIDRQGVIRSRSVDPDYTVRPEPAETVATLRSLASLT